VLGGHYTGHKGTSNSDGEVYITRNVNDHTDYDKYVWWGNSIRRD
jgi:hypothetical protein